MRLKTIVTGAVLAIVAAAALVTTTAVAASATTISIPAVSKFELRWQCAEGGGEFIESGGTYACWFPNGNSVWCETGGNCRIHYHELAPGTPTSTTPPTPPRPSASTPPVIDRKSTRL